MKKCFVCFLAAAMILPMLVLTACAGAPAKTAKDASGTYVRSNGDGASDDEFTIVLNENGRFTYYESVLASHIGMGRFTVEDGIVTLTEKWAPKNSGRSGSTYKFRCEGKKLIFIAEGSNEFPYIKLDDGAEFKRAK